MTLRPRHHNRIRHLCRRATVLLSLLVVVLAYAAGAGETEVDAPQRRSLRDHDFPGLETRVSFDLRRMEVVDVLKLLAVEGDLNVVASKDVSGPVTLLLQDVSVGEALERVLSIADLAYRVEGNVIAVQPNRDYEARQGVDFYDRRQTHVARLKYASPQRLAAMLENIKSDVGKIVYDDGTGMLVLVDTPAKIAMMKEIIEQVEIPTVRRVLPTETQVFELKYAALDDVKGEVQKALSPEIGTLHVDKRTNVLMVTDLPHQMKRIATLIQAFDRKPRVVFIEAKIVEVTLNDEFRAGIDWQRLLDFTLGGNSDEKGTYSITPSVNLPLGQTGLGKLRIASVGNDRLSVVLDAISSITDTEVLSNPHLIVAEGEEATINVSERQPYEEETTTTATGGTSTIAKTYQFVDVGRKLKVMPIINQDGFISLQIFPEISTISAWYGGPAQAAGAVPVVKKADAQTTVTVKDGVSIIIAGLITDRTSETEERVPVLGKLPLVGGAFRRRGTAVERKETIIFMTPRIVDGEGPVELTRDLPKPIRDVRHRAAPTARLATITSVTGSEEPGDAVEATAPRPPVPEKRIKGVRRKPWTPVAPEPEPGDPLLSATEP